MKSSGFITVLAFAYSIAECCAAPTRLNSKKPRETDVLNMILFGAAEANYPLTVPLDCTPIYTCKTLPPMDSKSLAASKGILPNK